MTAKEGKEEGEARILRARASDAVAVTRAVRNCGGKDVSQVLTSVGTEERDLAAPVAFAPPKVAMRPARTILPAPEGPVANAVSSLSAGEGSTASSSSTDSDATSSARRERESANSFFLPGRKRHLKSYSASVSHRRTCRRVCFGGCVQ